MGNEKVKFPTTLRGYTSSREGFEVNSCRGGEKTSISRQY